LLTESKRITPPLDMKSIYIARNKLLQRIAIAHFQALTG